MAEPAFSVIIPARNEEARLPRALEAIRSLAGGGSLEVLVVDNGSTDRTRTVAAGLGARVVERPDDTVAGLRNLGAELARGEVLLFIDADVAVAPDFLSAAARHLTDRSVGAVTGQILVPENGTWVEKTWFLNRLGKDRVREVDWSSSMNLVVRREAFTRAGGFSAALVSCEDLDLCGKIRQAGWRIIYDPAVQVTHFGEAKTLWQLFRKERWRGASAYELIRRHPRDPRRWASFLQFPFFLGAAAGVFAFPLAGRGGATLVALAGLNLLPLARAAAISSKTASLRHFFRLYLVWSVYYAARGTALLDRLRPPEAGKAFIARR